MGDLAELTVRHCWIRDETFGCLEFFISPIKYPQDLLGTYILKIHSSGIRVLKVDS